MGSKCSAATFNGVVRMMGSELKRKIKNQVIDLETQMSEDDLETQMPGDQAVEDFECSSC